MKSKLIVLRLLIILSLLLAVSVVSAKEQQAFPSEWKGYSKVIENVNKMDHIITIHYEKSKQINKQLTIKNNKTITIVQQYGLLDEYKWFGDGQAYGYYGHWILDGDINSGTLKYWINPTNSGIDPAVTVEAVKKGMDKWDNNVVQNIIIKD